MAAGAGLEPAFAPSVGLRPPEPSPDVSGPFT